MFFFIVILGSPNLTTFTSLPFLASTADFLDANDKFDTAMKAGETDFRAMQLSDEDISLMPDKLIESVVRTGGRADE